MLHSDLHLHRLHKHSALCRDAKFEVAKGYVTARGSGKSSMLLRKSMRLELLFAGRATFIKLRKKTDDSIRMQALTCVIYPQPEARTALRGQSTRKLNSASRQAHRESRALISQRHHCAKGCAHARKGSLGSKNHHGRHTRHNPAVTTAQACSYTMVRT